MNSFQRAVLIWMRERSVGAVRVCGQWVWPEDVRRDPALAEAIYWQIGG